MKKLSPEGILGLVLSVLGIGLGLAGQFSSALGIPPAWNSTLGWAGIGLVAVGILLGIWWYIRREPADIRDAVRAGLSDQLEALANERLRLVADLAAQEHFLAVATNYGDLLRGAKLTAQVAHINRQLFALDNRATKLSSTREALKPSRSERRERPAR